MTEQTAGRGRPGTGLAAIGLAVGFNVPYALLASTFSYPDVLRRAPGEVLAMFADGGSPLVLTWYAFMLSAVAMVPLAFALALTPSRVAAAPARAIGAAIAGALAGITQAIGLARWVFVVPGLAAVHGDAAAEAATREAGARAFALLNQYGGVAIGEHLGQLMTALFVALVASLQWREGRRVTAALGLLTAAAIAGGTGEGVALALGQPGDTFALATIAGFLGLTLWLIATGIGLMRRG